MAKTGILIPVMSKAEDLRAENFRHVLSLVQQHGHAHDLVVAQQVGGESRSIMSDVLELTPEATLLTFESTDPLIHKSKLVNMATEHHRKRGCDYALMIDADIHCNVRQLVRKLNELDPEVAPVVKPLRFFIRLDLEDSATVRRGEHVKVNIKDYPRKEVIDFPGAGSLAYSMGAFDAVGGMDESYVGWGWEDTDFSARLRNSLPWMTFSDVGFHLEHENDRVINQSNFNLFHEGTEDGGWNEMSVHVAHKLCLFSYGRCGSTMLALALAEHPDVNFFSAKSDDPDVDGCTELFCTRHFASKFPESWDHETLVQYLGEHLTSEGSKNVSGFKLMCGQPNAEAFPTIFSYIKNPQNRFTNLHVYRKDMLEQLCSFFVARASKRWMKAYGDFKTEIDVEMMKRKARENLAFATMLINECPDVLHVAYESLVSNWSETLWKVQRHLSLHPAELKQVTRSQRAEGQKWGDFVMNYAEVVEAYDLLEPELREEFPVYWNMSDKP